MALRLAVWNCNMRLHDKLEGLRRLAADVVVVPECACPEVLFRRAPGFSASSMLWTGRNSAKGLAVLSFGAWRVEFDSAHDPRGETTIAARISGPLNFRMVAAWARTDVTESLPQALDRLGGFLASGPSAVAGDFNATLATAGVGTRLHDLGLTSAYHGARERRLGSEEEPTLFLRRRQGVRGHRDAVFLDGTLRAALRGVNVGSRADWAGASDHAPVVVVLDTDPLVT